MATTSETMLLMMIAFLRFLRSEPMRVGGAIWFPNTAKLAIAGSQAATVIKDEAAGALAYRDLVTCWGEVHPFEMKTMIASKGQINTILTMNEFKDPLAGFKFQSTGELVSPLGSTLIRSDEVATDLIIGMDKRFAAEEVITQPLTVEYDKIIEQRFEEAVISESVAYAKIVSNAVKVLDTVWV